MFGYSKLTLVFALLGALVLAQQTSKLFGDGCCSGSKWQSKTASEKLEILWDNIIDNTKSASWPSTVTEALLFVESMDPTFDRVADDLPFDRKKLIHSVGNHAQIRFVVSDTSRDKYTGIFSSGSLNGIARLSPAAEPDPSNPTECAPQCGFIPGMSLKFLRSGIASANIVAMYSLAGQPSFNFFLNNFTNHPYLACDDIYGSLKLLYNKFRTASEWPTTVGLSTLAHYDEAGNVYDPPRFPYQLWFVPNASLTAQFPDFPPNYNDGTLAKQLEAIPAGTPLYTVYGLENPWDPAEFLGTIETTTAFTTSKWGDKDMFIQHTRMEEDVEFHPEWKSYLPTC